MVTDRHASKDHGATRIDFFQKRLESGSMIDHEMPRVVKCLRSGRISCKPDRVHQVARGIGDNRPDERNLLQRCAIEVRDAAFVQGPDYERVVVRLDGVQDPAGEAIDEMATCVAVDMRINAIDR